jgi:uncharacterized phage infection (PIP) family protein YhgE
MNAALGDLVASIHSDKAAVPSSKLSDELAAVKTEVDELSLACQYGEAKNADFKREAENRFQDLITKHADLAKDVDRKLETPSNNAQSDGKVDRAKLAELCTQFSDLSSRSKVSLQQHTLLGSQLSDLRERFDKWQKEGDRKLDAVAGNSQHGSAQSEKKVSLLSSQLSELKERFERSQKDVERKLEKAQNSSQDIVGCNAQYERKVCSSL